MKKYSSYTQSGTGRPVEEFTASKTLQGFLNNAIERAEQVNPRFAQLWREIARVANGGKGVRPQLLHMAAHSYPARPVHPVINAAGAGFELLHTALLIHDDVIDQDELRRHQPTINAAAERRAATRMAVGDRAASAVETEHTKQYGRSVGILAGDLALTGAYRLIATSHAPESRLLRLLAILDEAVFRSAAGEFLDVEHALPGVTVSNEEILLATRLKTSAYSFEAPLTAGAVLGGAPVADVNVLGDVGRAMGTAYQLADDVLGVFGDPERTGKSAQSDLREGKRTMLISLAEHGPYGPKLREILDRVAVGGLSDEDAHAAKDLLERCGARAGVERMAEQAAQRARDLLEDSQLPAALVGNLLEVTDGIVRRTR
ncbi:polyprenyl synthetase family protein [Kocuria sp. cx-455]|uniref:polyprenyl synthetase family protein n=1 Tax=Kocuria sp. cx-455 TaxID=2771377 RepID=UPI001689FBCA|nr:polyprenyl synthetase family protein [Kocuria sp. cx-455]MBD2765730.1 polyprenyl synthetase family protein [Kocuria sp. cx-455]